MRLPWGRPGTRRPMGGPAPQRRAPAAAATALLLLPLVLHCESSVSLPLSVLLERYCEALSALYNVTGPYCNATTDQIGTCWPRATAGELVERPCPEFLNGIKYNTTRFRVQQTPEDTIVEILRDMAKIDSSLLASWQKKINGLNTFLIPCISFVLMGSAMAK
ncbi:hypothetical protein KIL84_011344, partial [Mauremys mutica]